MKLDSSLGIFWIRKLVKINLVCKLLLLVGWFSSSRMEYQSWWWKNWTLNIMSFQHSYYPNNVSSKHLVWDIKVPLWMCMLFTIEENQMWILPKLTWSWNLEHLVSKPRAPSVLNGSNVMELRILGWSWGHM